MEYLKKALQTRIKYNEMPLEDFVKLLESYLGKTIPIHTIESFKNTGLLNIDLFLRYVKL